MRKSVRLLIFATLFSLFLCGCSNHSSESNVGKDISFLMYEYDKESDGIIANRLVWDVENSYIGEEEPLYKMGKKEISKDYVEPIWYDDGNIFINEYQETSFYEDLKINIEKIKNVSNAVFGKNIKMFAQYDENQKFKEHEITIYKSDGKTEIIKSSDFVLEKENKKIGVYPSYIKYDEKRNIITSIALDYTSEHLKEIYVFKMNLNEKENINKKTIELSEKIETNGGAMPTIFNSVLVENIFYFQSYNSLGYCDIENGDSGTLDSLVEQCRNVVKEGRFKPDFEKAVIPVGNNDNMLFLKLPISTNVDLEYLICAVEKNNIVGSLLLRKNGKWEVRNKENELTSIFDVSERDLYIKFYEYITIEKK